MKKASNEYKTVVHVKKGYFRRVTGDDFAEMRGFKPVRLIRCLFGRFKVIWERQIILPPAPPPPPEINDVSKPAPRVNKMLISI